MPVTNVKTTRSAAAAVGYNVKGRGEKWREHTLLGTTRAVWRLTTWGDEEMFVRYCEQSKARSDGVEALTYVISWPDTELDPDDPASWEAAGRFAQAFAEEHAAGHPYDISVHVDGQGRKVHCHLALANRSVDDETLLTTKKQITRHSMVARACDELARERGFGVIERQRAGGWEAMRAKHVEAVERGGAAKAKAQAKLAIGDVLASIYEAGDFTSVDEWIERCAEAGIEAELQPDKQHDGVPGLVYKMQVEVDGKSRKRRSKASAVSVDFTVAGIEARVSELHMQSRLRVAEALEAAAAERAEQRKRELERREEQVQRDLEQAQARHAVPDVAREFERRWDDVEHMSFTAADVVHAAGEVRARVDLAREAGADASVCDALSRELDDVVNGEMPKPRRNAPHVDVADAMADEVSREARAELSVSRGRYRHAVRDRSAAEEALERLREREAKAAEAETKADDASGFVRRSVRYAMLMFRWFQMGIARYDLLQAIGADGEAPNGDELTGVNGVVFDGIASMEHTRRFERAAAAGEMERDDAIDRGESLQ